MGFGPEYSMPSSSFGYYRGAPLAGGQGAGQGNGGNATGWSPTILYLFALIIAEMFIFGFIGRTV